MRRIETGPEMSFLAATAEKAISDKVRDDRGNGLTTVSEMKTYLREILRVDMSALADLDSAMIEGFAERYRSRKVRLLAAVIHDIRNNGGLSNE